MDFDTRLADEAAEYLKRVTPSERTASDAPEPDPEECLRCYVDRMVAAHGCDTSLRFAKKWLAGSAVANPRKVLRWFESNGGCCDCEVLMNVLPDHWPLDSPADP